MAMFCTTTGRMESERSTVWLPSTTEPTSSRSDGMTTERTGGDGRRV